MADFLPHRPSAEVVKPAYCICERPGRHASISIGIPTVRRDKRNYLMDTLDNLISYMSPEEQADTILLVFIAETDLNIVYQVAEEIRSRFEDEVTSGLIEIISPPAAFYPSLDNLRQNYGDSKERVKWRSKQNLDFAFLMNYAKSRSTYYVQLEDDIIAAKGFVSQMKARVEARDKMGPWMMVSFCELGFIGKLFKTAELPWFIMTFVMFFDEKPVDMLLGDIIAFKACGLGVSCDGKQRSKLEDHFKPSLFQHMGTHSSLRGKRQDLIDTAFGELPTYFPHDNPAAKVQTLIPPLDQKYDIVGAYMGRNLFWGEAAKSGDFICFNYDPPVRIKRFLFRTGNMKHPNKTLPDTTLIKLRSISTGTDAGDNKLLQVGHFDAFGVSRGHIGLAVGLVSQLRIEVNSQVDQFILSEILIVISDGK